MNFGIFLAPFHPVGQNPALAIESDLQLIEHLDGLGFEEAWIGEHHSAGYEIIGSPEVFIAAASQRTRSIRLGTGVVSLPYHNPFIVADRIVFLDNLTRGRIMLGVGPGALPSDAFMLGINPNSQRFMMEQSLEAITMLINGEEPITMETDWFVLKNARLQLKSYSKSIEMAVAAQVSPAGPRAAGRFGLGLLSIGATTLGGFDALSTHWSIMEQRSQEYHTTVDRNNWRLVGPVHIAESLDKARENVKYGLSDWIYYFRNVAALPLVPEGTKEEDVVDALIETGMVVIGTPNDAIEQIYRLLDKSKGFGTFLIMATDWANKENTFYSYELFAKYVAPEFKDYLSKPKASMTFAQSNRSEFIGAAVNAVVNAFKTDKA